MFEFMNDIIESSRKNPEGANVFYPVSQSDIAEAEIRLKRLFPDELKAFFGEIGCGFLKAGKADLSRTSFNYLNRFLDPGEIADICLGEDEDMAPSEGFAADELPFFEIADQLYLVIRPDGNNPHSICWPYGDPIADDLLIFVSRLINDPRFYHSNTRSAS